MTQTGIVTGKKYIILIKDIRALLPLEYAGLMEIPLNTRKFLPSVVISSLLLEKLSSS